jgi:hypothetical protein
MKNWSNEMETLYAALQSGEVAIEKAEALANICGKALKYEALEFAREVFAENVSRRGNALLPSAEDQTRIVSHQ